MEQHRSKQSTKVASKGALSASTTVNTLGTTATLGPLLPQNTLNAPVATSKTTAYYRPSPLNLAEYLPFACRELNVDACVRVNKTVQPTYVSVLQDSQSIKPRTKSKLHQTDTPQSESSISPLPDSDSLGMCVNITAEYDSNNNLRHLKFINNKKIPTGVLQILNLIVHFHTQLRAFTLRRGLNKKVLVQINFLQSLANLTELNLENCPFPEGCYYVLLESHSTLKVLCLPRCKIEDDAIESISARLKHPYKASKTLVVLDLTSNKITDLGAKYLSDALKTNRKLSTLILMNNLITDQGAFLLLDKLMPFVLSPEECRDLKLKRASYNAYKSTLIVQAISDELNKTTVKRLDSSPIAKRKLFAKIMDSETTLLGTKGKSGISVFSKEFPQITGYSYEKAKAKVERLMPPFRHPYEQNTVMDENRLCCGGNHSLRYLNLAYNELTIATLTRLVKVLTLQGNPSKGGLISVNLDGNPMPVNCSELIEIDEVLRNRLESLMPTRNSMTKRRRSTKVP